MKSRMARYELIVARAFMKVTIHDVARYHPSLVQSSGRFLDKKE